MHRPIHRALSLAFCAALVSCDLLTGGGGGGGGSSTITFSRGFVYVRRDDRNLYLADESDLQSSGQLTTSGGVYTPSLSKDGKRIVYVLRSATESELDLVGVVGGTSSVLLKSTASVKNLRTPVFSPDGARVAFAFDEPSGSSIGLINVDGSGFIKVIGGAAFAYASPTFFPDGQSVLAMAGGAGLAYTQVERVNLTTGQAINITNTLGVEAEGISTRLMLSPDGTQAVFDARVSSGSTRVFILDLATKKVTLLNDYTGEPNTNDSAPAWQSAATVVYSSDSGGNDNVYRIGANGASRKLVLPKAIEPYYGP
jgi:TolB protein